MLIIAASTHHVYRSIMGGEAVVEPRHHAVRLARDNQRGIHQADEWHDAMANTDGQHQHLLPIAS